jgi:hypothetical protein
MICKFVVGQKVAVCKGGMWPDHRTGSPGVQMTKGAVFTVAEIAPESPWGHWGPYLALSELPDLMCHHSGFEPLNERKTDISTFTKMLRPTEERVR